MRIINPPGDPGHCPPGVIYLMSLRGDQVQRLRLFHPSRDVAQNFLTWASDRLVQAGSRPWLASSTRFGDVGIGPLRSVCY
jgi:hypothetical protein